MRTTSTLVGVVWLAVTAPAVAQEPEPVDATVAPPPTEPAPTASVPPAPELPLTATAPAREAPRRRFQLGAAFIGMGLGKTTQVLKGVRENSDALFAYGLAITADYRIVGGLTLGLAPQAILNVKAKDSLLAAARQIDLLARVAYACPIADGSLVYAEVLSGYSIIVTDDRSKGMVVAVGAGVAIDLPAETFASFGLGYQVGFQKFQGDPFSTTYVRAALGGGMRF
jgi:hypothetical protein